MSPRGQRGREPGSATDRTGTGFLYLTVAFGAGWVIMMEEILAGRVLAPHFGYSVYQWGALIGVVMAALAGGYLVGGRLGDSPRSPAFLQGFLVAAAVLAALQPALSDGLVPYTRTLGPAWGSVVASAGLVGPLCLVLATVSPMIISLTLREKGVAHTAGRVYAVSTVGSIGGTFFAAFYAIPVLGTRTSHWVATGLVAALAIALALGRRRWLGAAVGVTAIGILLLADRSSREPRAGLVYEAESIHNSIQVVDDGPRRNLYLNYTDSPQTQMNKQHLLTGHYFDYFLLAPALNEGRQVLFLGVAGGVALRQMVQLYPQLEVTGVDLDPEVLHVAREFFQLADLPRLDLVAGDARHYLEGARPGEYDVVAVDLFVTGHVPFFCATREFFELVESRLAEDGILMMNVVSRSRGRELVGPFEATLGSVFPTVYRLADKGNHLFIASRVELDVREVLQAMQARPLPRPVRELAARALPSLRRGRVESRWPLFTDDRSDIELRSFRAFQGVVR